MFLFSGCSFVFSLLKWPVGRYFDGMADSHFGIIIIFHNRLGGYMVTVGNGIISIFLFNFIDDYLFSVVIFNTDRIGYGAGKNID